MLKDLALVMISATVAIGCSKGHSPSKRSPIEFEEVNEDEVKIEEESRVTAPELDQTAEVTPTPTAPPEVEEPEVSFRYNVPGGNNLSLGRLNLSGTSNTFPFPASLKRHTADASYSITGTWTFAVTNASTLELDMQTLASNCSVITHDYLVLGSDDMPVAFAKAVATSGTWHKVQIQPPLEAGNYKLVNYIESSNSCGLVHQFEAELLQ
jgi:hypothetical protein